MKQKTKFKQTEIRKIPEDWDVKKIKEICEQIFSDGTPNTRKEEYWNGNLRWLSSGETRQTFIRDTERKITQEGVDNSSTRLAKKEDVVVAGAGQGHTRGQPSICLIDTYVNQSIVVLRSNKNYLNSFFLFYNLLSRYNELRQLSDAHSSRGSLTTKLLAELYIKLPTIKEQGIISKILSNLDVKIELNNKMNKTLETIGQAIFKKWFVDERKEEWEIKKIKEIVAEKKHAIVDGPFGTQLHNDEYVLEDVPVIRIINLSFEGHFINENLVFVTEDKFNFLKRSAVYPGDILLAKTGATIGKFSINPNYIKKAIIASSILKISPKESNRHYLYYIIKDLSDKKYLESISSGSTRSTINLIDVRDIEIVIPDSEILNGFESLMKSFFSIIETNNLQSQKLSQIRDALLPKLMSGKIRVK